MLKKIVSTDFEKRGLKVKLGYKEVLEVLLEYLQELFFKFVVIEVRDPDRNPELD